MIDSYSTKDIYLYLKMHYQLEREDMSNMTYMQFLSIIEEFNKEISKEIIKGYSFNSALGTIEIVKRKRKHKVLAINWNESKKNRQRLIDEGKVPYDKETAPNGINWFIYFTDTIRYKWTWTRSSKIFNWMQFYTTTDNKRQLGRSINKNEDLKDSYKYTNMYEGHLKPKHNFEDFKNLSSN